MSASRQFIEKSAMDVAARVAKLLAIATSVPVATPCTALTSLLIRETISPERVAV
jgi:hypothetical protein